MVGADESIPVPLCTSLLVPLLAPRPVIRGRHTSDTKSVGSSIPKQVVSCCPCRLWSGADSRGTWRRTACTGATGMGLRAPAGAHVPSRYANTFAARCFMACRGPPRWRPSIKLDSWSSTATCLSIVFRTTPVADDDSLTHKLLRGTCFVRPATSHGLLAVPSVSCIVPTYIPLTKV